MYRIILSDPLLLSNINDFYRCFFETILIKYKNELFIPEYYLNDYVRIHSFFANII